MAFCEVSQEQTPGSAAYAGDFGFKVLTSSDPAEKTKKLNAEIANGRLAMMAIIGMFFQAIKLVCFFFQRVCLGWQCCLGKEVAIISEAYDPTQVVCFLF